MKAAGAHRHGWEGATLERKGIKETPGVRVGCPLVLPRCYFLGRTGKVSGSSRSDFADFEVAVANGKKCCIP